MDGGERDGAREGGRSAGAPVDAPGRAAGGGTMTDREPDPPAEAPPPPPRRNAGPGPRIDSKDKRRNRRRKSKYARPLISVAHGLVLLQVMLLGLFVLALAQGLLSGADATLRGAEPRTLGDLNLPGSDPVAARRSGVGAMQFLIWAYLFGAPLIFAGQRWGYWQRTASGAKYVTLSLLAVWSVVIMVILVTANLG